VQVMTREDSCLHFINGTKTACLPSYVSAVIMTYVPYDLSSSNEKVPEKYNSYERHVTVVDPITRKLMISRGGVTRW
jgi:hypothetical protein